ncbi:MAG: hypothetical protein FWG66_14960 [Spirochaetes bacterium]|nr:hypothetical protein [Spirochaetota bacterium]
MAGPLNAKVILERCSKHKKSFGNRIEQREGDWVSTWAFPIDEQKGKREGFDANIVIGSLKPVDGYPGCPYCGSTGTFLCGCQKVSCDGGIANHRGFAEIVCPWCDQPSGRLQYVESIEVSGKGY